MKDVIVAVVAKLVGAGAKDIALLVSSISLGQPSPARVIEDGVEMDVFREQAHRLEEILQREVAKRAGYTVERQVMIAANEARESADNRANLESRIQQTISDLERSFDL